jgi:2-phospho-L-lactate guanylyltransferase
VTDDDAGRGVAPESARSERESAKARIERQAIAEFEAKPRDTTVRRTGAAFHGRDHETEPTDRWLVVVPVKGTADAKSRLQAGADLALAIALDTVQAAASAPGVSAVIVVTHPSAAVAFDEVDAFVEMLEQPGLDTAVAAGLATAATFAAPGLGVAVMLGDLPALQPSELGTALAAAALVDRAMVADATGTGTTLITARDGASHDPAFGAGSAAAHGAAGYVPLDVPVTSGLRRDVDTAEDLAALAGRLGSRTARLALHR